MNLIRSVQKESYLEAVGIVDENGISTYDTGEQKDVSERAYFQQAMKGERTLSDPLVSKLIGEQRVNLRRSHLSGRRDEGCRAAPTIWPMSEVWF